MTLEEYQDSLNEIKNPAFGSDIKKVSEDDNNFFEYLGVKEGDLKKKSKKVNLIKKAKIGDIWITIIRKLYLDDETGNINVLLEKRPCLIIDNGRGFIIEENSNYSGLKLITRKSKLNNVKRIEIKNWKELG